MNADHAIHRIELFSRILDLFLIYKNTNHSDYTCVGAFVIPKGLLSTVVRCDGNRCFSNRPLPVVHRVFITSLTGVF